jgi:Flp pilus assembly pilin Flp
MLSAFIKDESGGVAITYGVLALALTAAIVSVVGMVGSVMGHSYSAIPDEAIQTVPSMEGLSQVAGYFDGFKLGEMIRLSGGGM